MIFEYVKEIKTSFENVKNKNYTVVITKTHALLFLYFFKT